MPVKSLYSWQIAACNKIQAPPSGLSSRLYYSQRKEKPAAWLVALASHALPNTSIHVLPVPLLPLLSSVRVRALDLTRTNVAFARDTGDRLDLLLLFVNGQYVLRYLRPDKHKMRLNSVYEP